MSIARLANIQLHCVLRGSILRPADPAITHSNPADDSSLCDSHEALSHMVAGPLSPHMRLQQLPDYRNPKVCKRSIARSSSGRQSILPANHLNWKHEGTASSSRVFVVSDLHTDYTENMAWVKCLSAARHGKDILLVAGDVAETYKKFVQTMSLLKDRFQRVFYVPGNHDLWCRWEGEKYIDSIEKLDALLDACSRLGVETNPGIVNGLGIIPLFSWYHESFDKEKDIKGIRIPSLEMACKDFHACKWPLGLSSKDASIAQYFDAMNERNHDILNEILRSCHQIITFSYFLPGLELCPEKRMLFYPNLPKIIGSDYLEARLRLIHGTRGNPSACHVFGHTHFCWDAVLDGIRYVQAPLAYPREETENEWWERLATLLHLLQWAFRE